MKLFLSKFPGSLKEFKSLRVLVTDAMLTALYVVAAFLLNIYLSPTTRIGFAFVFLMIAAKLYGPFSAMAIGGIGDVLQYILAPRGNFSVGITLCTILTGLVFGLWLYKEKPTVLRCTLACLTVSLFVDALLKTYVLKFLVGVSFRAEFVLRIGVVGLMFVIMAVVGFITLNGLEKITAGLRHNAPGLRR